MRLGWLVISVGFLLTAGPAHADNKDIVIRSPGERSNENLALCGGLAAGAIILGGVGVYYNLDSRDASNKVSADRPINQPWTPALAADYDRAHDSKTKAEVF